MDEDGDEDEDLVLGGKDSCPFLPCANMVLTSTRVEAAGVHFLLGGLVFPKSRGFLTPLEKPRYPFREGRDYKSVKWLGQVIPSSAPPMGLRKSFWKSTLLHSEKKGKNHCHISATTIL